MEIALILVVAVLLAYGAVRYRRAYREAREYQEVHAAWGSGEREQAEAIYNGLLERGLRVKLKTIGMPDIARMLPQRLTSVRVHRDDYVEAVQVIRSLTGR